MDNAPVLPFPLAKQSGWPFIQGEFGAGICREAGRNEPRISIVTPSYNQAQFLEGTIRSILLQGYPNLEYFVIDGGSTDGSVDIIRRYEPWLTHWVSEPDRGQSHAINKGFGGATGDIFHWLNSDDFLLHGALDHIARLYVDNPRAVAWVGGCHWVDEERWIYQTTYPRGLSKDEIADWGFKGYFQQPGCFVRADAWKSAGGLDESLNFAIDLDLWLRICDEGALSSTETVLAASTFHARSKSRTITVEGYEETALVQRKHGYVEEAERRMVLASKIQNPGFRLGEGIRAFLKPIYGRYIRRERL